MKKNYYLGIDVGTTGTKALIMDAAGKVKATDTSPHQLSIPKPSWSEQNPEQWWQATKRAIRSVIGSAGIDGKSIAAIGLSGQMHGLVCLDEKGKVLRPAIIWNDQRSAKEANLIEQTVGGKSALIKMAGNIAVTSFTLTKLLWVRRHEPEVYRKIRQILLPKDYVRFRLTGQYAGDVSDMSGTLMLNQQKRNWSEEIINKFDIDRRILPPVYESHEITGYITSRSARQTGLCTGTPVVAGAGDQPAGAVGLGIVKRGLVSAALGTSGVVFTHLDKYITDPTGRIQTFCSAVAGEYCMFGCILSAGGSLEWLSNVLKEQNFKSLDAQARQAREGCNGLFFLPYLTGERTPHLDPHARGSWVGITVQTTRADLIRSVMEGVAFAMNDAMMILRERGIKPGQIRLSGGGAKSTLWRKIQANVYGANCTTLQTEQGPAYGAAILAAVGAGQFNSVKQACDKIIKITNTTRPDAKTTRMYRRYYKQYHRLYPALKDEFPKIAKL